MRGFKSTYSREKKTGTDVILGEFQYMGIFAVAAVFGFYPQMRQNLDE